MVRIQSYSKLIKTTVIIGDTLLCGVMLLSGRYALGENTERPESSDYTDLVAVLRVVQHEEVGYSV